MCSWRVTCFTDIAWRHHVIAIKQWIPLSQIAKFTGPTLSPPGSCRPQVGPMLAPRTLLSGETLNPISSANTHLFSYINCEKYPFNITYNFYLQKNAYTECTRFRFLRQIMQHTQDPTQKSKGKVQWDPFHSFWWNTLRCFDIFQHICNSLDIEMCWKVFKCFKSVS